MKPTPLNNTENDGHIGRMLSEIMSHALVARTILIVIVVANALLIPGLSYRNASKFDASDITLALIELFVGIEAYLLLLIAGKRLKAVLRLYKEEHNKMSIHK